MLFSLGFVSPYALNELIDWLKKRTANATGTWSGAALKIQNTEYRIQNTFVVQDTNTGHRSDLGIMIADFPIFGGRRKFEGTDDVCTLSTHTSVESGERRLSSDV